MACCPAHEDKTPSLSIKEEDDSRVLIHCFAGCGPAEVVGAVGLELSDLFPDDPTWTPSTTRRSSPPARTIEDARFTLEYARVVAEEGPGLTETGYKQCADAIETLLRAGIRPEWTPERRPDDPYPLPIPQPEFLKQEFPPEEPILGPFKTQQLGLIYAPTGAGKTMFCLALGAAMALQINFLRWKHSGREVRVLYVDGEMSAWELQHRVRDIQAPNLFLASSVALSLSHGVQPLNLAAPEGHAVLLEWVRTLQIDVIFLDNLMSLSWIEGVSINSDEAWRPVNRLLLELRGMGRTVFVIDHANQQGLVHGTKTKAWHLNHSISLSPIGTDENEEIRAFDGELKGVPRPRIRVAWKKHRGTPETAENGGTLTEEIVATIGEVGHPWNVEGGREAMRREVIEMNRIGMSIRDIQEEVGVPKSTIHRWIKEGNV